MAHQQFEVEDKVKKFSYKMIWQWVKEQSITFSLFVVLCRYIGRGFKYE